MRHGGGASQALASTAETAVYLQIDNDKIIASAPTRIDLVVNADGTLTAPDLSSVKLANESAFAIHVSQIEYEAQGGWNYSATPTGAQNEIDLSVTPGSGEDYYQADETKTIESADWNMTGKDTAGSAIELSCAGEARNITKDLGMAQQIGTINWTFAAGAHKSAAETLADQYQASYDAASEKGELSSSVFWWVEGDNDLVIAPKNGVSGSFSRSSSNTPFPTSIKSASVKPGVSAGYSLFTLFNNCSSLSDVSGLANLDVSNAKNISRLFSDCSSLSSLSPLAGWDVSSVTSMSGMFDGCSSLNDVSPLANWDVSSVTQMDYMFKNCPATPPSWYKG